MNTQKILSWNVNSLNSPQKRRKTSLFLEKQKYDLICLQEMHIKSKDQRLLIKLKLGTLFSTSSESKQRGVAIYIKTFLEPKLLEIDPKDRWLSTEAQINKSKTHIFGIYVSNNPSERERFFKKPLLELRTMILKQ